MKKIYYKIKFSNISALSIGSGENVFSDKDVIRNVLGKPYIPGSSLAGVYRTMFNVDEQNRYFGSLKSGDIDRQNSKIIIYDANIMGNYKISIKHGVALDENKTSIDGCKMDIEVIEPGAQFITYIEIDDIDEIGDTIIEEWASNNLTIGAKTSRGLGVCKLESVKRTIFVLPDEAEKWYKFNMYDNQEGAWEKYDLTPVNKQDKTIRLLLKLDGGVSIREYTTATKQGGDSNKSDAVPDYENLKYKRAGGIFPYIPGTSWAGAFRHHMLLVNKDLTEEIFGSTKKKSSIHFSDTEIIGFKEKIISRNAIDRFSGGTKKGALYTEKFIYGGEVHLNIKLHGEYEGVENLLAYAITDLHYGLLSVGGLTSIGRGIFKVEKINECNIDSSNASDLYKLIKKQIEEHI